MTVACAETESGAALRASATSRVSLAMRYGKIRAVDTALRGAADAEPTPLTASARTKNAVERRRNSMHLNIGWRASGRAGHRSHSREDRASG